MSYPAPYTAAERLLNHLVYVYGAPRFSEGADRSHTGTVISVDVAGLLLRTVATERSQRELTYDTGQLRFLPWTSIDYVSVQDE